MARFLRYDYSLQKLMYGSWEVSQVDKISGKLYSCGAFNSLKEATDWCDIDLADRVAQRMMGNVQRKFSNRRR